VSPMFGMKMGWVIGGKEGSQPIARKAIAKWKCHSHNQSTDFFFERFAEKKVGRETITSRNGIDCQKKNKCVSRDFGRQVHESRSAGGGGRKHPHS
jgi:hypothetical protein